LSFINDENKHIEEETSEIPVDYFRYKATKSIEDFLNAQKE